MLRVYQDPQGTTHLFQESTGLSHTGHTLLNEHLKTSQLISP